MRRPSIAVTLLGLSLLIAACGAPTATPSATAPPATTASTASPAPSGSPATGAEVCVAPAAATVTQTEGPYYSAGAPESADLTTDSMAGTRLTLTGRVLGTDCVPLAGAKVEIWQADSAGVYDNRGYTLRGYVTTDAEGRYAIRTVVPGEYPGRTEHIHVKVTPAGGDTLTTQLYFAGSTANEGDNIYSPTLLLDIAPDGDALIGRFTFIVGA